MDIEDSIELIEAAVEEYFDSRQYITFLSQNLSTGIVEKREVISYETYKKRLIEEAERKIKAQYEDKALIIKINENILDTFIKKRGDVNG